MHRFAVALSVLGLVAGCRRPIIAELRVRDGAASELRFRADGPVELWGGFEGVWTGANGYFPPMRFEVEVRQHGRTLGHIVCASAGSAPGGQEHRLEGGGDVELGCNLPKHAPGEIVLRVRGSLVDTSHIKKLHALTFAVRAG